MAFFSLAQFYSTNTMGTGNGLHKDEFPWTLLVMELLKSLWEEGEMNSQVLSMLTSTHELADGMEKGILLSSQTNVQIYCNAAFTNLTKEQF